MEYSVYDAVRAGFHKIVFIIKPGMEPTIRALCGDRIETMHTPQGEPVEVAYAVQDFSSIPAFYTIPPERKKPFGTVHAALCARDVVRAVSYTHLDVYKRQHKGFWVPAGQFHHRDLALAAGRNKIPCFLPFHYFRKHRDINAERLVCERLRPCNRLGQLLLRLIQRRADRTQAPCIGYRRSQLRRCQPLKGPLHNRILDS